MSAIPMTSNAADIVLITKKTAVFTGCSATSAHKNRRAPSE